MALTLAACAGAGEPVPAAAPATSSPAPLAAQNPAPASPQQQATPQIAIVAPIAGVRGLMGITREALGARLGQAGFVRRDGPAEVLRFRGSACLLDVFVYREADNTQRVTHVDARTLQGRPTPPDPCLDALEKEKKG
ncbi:MAG: hypothetical protein JNJ97_11640 [Alphaproteobacteria bacterium]|nr:hypothetical protein [Alphaproteobacteria bacterium]MCA0448621.1 hypothetical protein [Pseudomonadota bacterium]